MSTYTLVSVGGSMPTQAEGRTSDDRPFYFRARHGEWTLDLGETTDPTDLMGWAGYGEPVAEGDDPSYGCMTEAQVREILDAAFGVSE